MDKLNIQEFEGQLSDLLRRELRRIHRTQDDDLFQDAWSMILARWHRLISSYDGGRGTWDRWIKAVVHNILIDCARRSRRHPTRVISEKKLEALVDHRFGALIDDEYDTAWSAVHEALNLLRTRLSPGNYEAAPPAPDRGTCRQGNCAVRWSVL